MVFLKITVHIGKTAICAIRTKTTLLNNMFQSLNKSSIVVHPVEIGFNNPMQIPSIVGLTKQFVHSFTPQLISGGSYGPYQKMGQIYFSGLSRPE
jgi:hypothetical protein